MYLTKLLQVFDEIQAKDGTIEGWFVILTKRKCVELGRPKINIKD
jgi:hypothetical protein